MTKLLTRHYPNLSNAFEASGRRGPILNRLLSDLMSCSTRDGATIAQLLIAFKAFVEGKRILGVINTPTDVAPNSTAELSSVFLLWPQVQTLALQEECWDEPGQVFRPSRDRRQFAWLVFAIRAFIDGSLVFVLTEDGPSLLPADIEGVHELLSRDVKETDLDPEAKELCEINGIKLVGELYQFDWAWATNHPGHAPVTQWMLRHGLHPEFDPLDPAINWRPPYWEDAEKLEKIQRPLYELFCEQGHCHESHQHLPNWWFRPWMVFPKEPTHPWGPEFITERERDSGTIVLVGDLLIQRDGFHKRAVLGSITPRRELIKTGGLHMGLIPPPNFHQLPRKPQRWQTALVEEQQEAEREAARIMQTWSFDALPEGHRQRYVRPRDGFPRMCEARRGMLGENPRVIAECLRIGPKNDPPRYIRIRAREHLEELAKFPGINQFLW